MDIEEGFTGPYVATSYPLTCPPDSPACSPLTSAPHVPQMKTFIHAHGPSSNPCIHPSLLALSTPFLSTTGPPRPPRGGVPIPSLTHSLGWGGEGIRVGSLYGFFEGDGSEGGDREGYEGEIPWEEREDTLVWRGSTTGARFQEDTMWRESQRVRLVTLANGVQLDAEAEGVSPSSEEIVSVIDPLWSGLTTITNNTLSIPLSTLRSSLSISFTNPPGPIQCSPDMCALLREMFDFVPSMTSINAGGEKGKGTEGGYRYLLDVRSFRSIHLTHWHLLTCCSTRNAGRRQRLVRPLQPSPRLRRTYFQSYRVRRVVRASRAAVGALYTARGGVQRVLGCGRLF